MKVITAQEAHNNTKPNIGKNVKKEFEHIMESIEEAVSNGEFICTERIKFKDNIDKLLEYGYKIHNLFPGEKDSFVSISWS